MKKTLAAGIVLLMIFSGMLVFADHYALRVQADEPPINYMIYGKVLGHEGGSPGVVTVHFISPLGDFNTDSIDTDAQGNFTYNLGNLDYSGAIAGLEIDLHADGGSAGESEVSVTLVGDESPENMGEMTLKTVDIEATDLDVSAEEVDVLVGREVTISAMVYHRGTRDAVDVDVSFYKELGGTEELIDTTRYNGITDLGQEASVEYSFTVEGAYTIRVHAEPVDYVDYGDYDNEATTLVNVGEPAFLSLVSLEFSDNAPMADSMITIYANITNTGPIAGTCEIVFYADGVPLHTYTETVSALSTRSVQHIWTVVSGQTTIRVDIQEPDYYADINPAEYTLSETITGSFFDLGIESLEFSPGKVVGVGDTLEIRAIVRNYGNLAGYSNVTFKVGTTTIDTVPTTSINPGAARTVTTTHEFATEGVFTITVELVDFSLPDYDETNNQASDTVTASLEGPDAQVKSLTGPEVVYEGDLIRFTAEIENIGLDEINSGWVYFYHGDPIDHQDFVDETYDNTRLIGTRRPLPTTDSGAGIAIKSFPSWDPSSLLVGEVTEIEIYVMVVVTDPIEFETDDNWGRMEMELRIRPPYVDPNAASPTLVPRPDDIDVPVGTTITIVFSKDMNQASVENGFTLKAGAMNVAGGFAWTDARTMVFTPSTDLEYGYQYTVTVKDTATDLNGIMIDGNNDMIPGGDLVYSFTTIAEADTWGPTAYSLNVTPDPTEDATHVTLYATIDDTESGNTWVHKAEYSWGDDFLPDGIWNPMTFVQRDYSSVEDFYATVDIRNKPDATTHHLWARGWDLAGNVGDAEHIAFYKSDRTPPVFQGIQDIEDLGYGGALEISWNAANDDSIPITYNIYSTSTLSGGVPVFNYNNPVEWITDSSAPGTPLTLVLEGLKNNLRYYINIRAVDAEGNTAMCNTYLGEKPTDVQAPYWADPATALQVTETGEDGKISIWWDAAYDDNTDPQGNVLYTIMRDGVAVATGLGLNHRPYVDTLADGLVLGETYDYIIRAVDNSGNFADVGPESATSIDDLAPRFDSESLTAEDTGEGRRIRLEWDAAEDDSTITYRIYWGESPPNGTNPVAEISGTKYIAQVPHNGVTYYFMVRPVDESGNEYAGSYFISASATDTTPPAFTGLDAAVDAGEYGMVNVYWNPAQDNSGPIWYMVYCSNNITNLWNEEFDRWNENMLSMENGRYKVTVDGLENGHTYYFGVRAMDSADNWEYNNIIGSAIPTDSTPPEFEGLQNAWPVDIGGTVFLVWNESTDASEEYGHNITYNIYVSDNPDAVIHRNRYLAETVVSSTSLILEHDADGNPLENGKTYYFLVRAVDWAGNSDNNTIVIAATPQDTVPPIFAGLEEAENLAYGGAVQLSWQPGTDRYPVTYTVYRSDVATSPGAGDLTIVASEITSTSYTIEGLENGETYYFLVRAEDYSGNMGMNMRVESVTPTDEVPAQFTGLKSAEDRMEGGKVLLMWSPATDTDTSPSAGITYMVFRHTTAAVNTSLGSADHIHTTTATSYTDSGLVDGTRYHYSVQAYDASGNVDMSDVVLSALPTRYWNNAPIITANPLEPMEDDRVGRTEMNFTAFYRDIDGDAPAYVRLVIAGRDPINMDPMGDLPFNYAEGVEYGYKLYLDPGEYNYRFTTMDDPGEASTASAMSRMTGWKTLTITAVNNPPVLGSPSIFPSAGDIEDIFRFSVTYRDADGDPPIHVRLVVGDTSYNMRSTSGVDDFTSAVTFSHTMSLEAGTHTYYFIASDGKDETRTADRTITVDEPAEESSSFFDFMEETYYGLSGLIWLLLIILVLVGIILVAKPPKKKPISKSSKNSGGQKNAGKPEDMMVDCPTCGSKLQVSTDKRPVEIDCPNCQSQLRIE